MCGYAWRAGFLFPGFIDNYFFGLFLAHVFKRSSRHVFNPPAYTNTRTLLLSLARNTNRCMYVIRTTGSERERERGKRTVIELKRVACSLAWRRVGVGFFFMGLSRIIILALTCRGGNSDRFNQTYYHLLFSLKRNKHKYITTGRQDICQARAPRVACCVRVCVECGLFCCLQINTVTRQLLIIGGGAILRQIGVGYD